MMKNRNNFSRVIFLKISLVKLRSSSFLRGSYTACGSLLVVSTAVFISLCPLVHILKLNSLLRAQ